MTDTNIVRVGLILPFSSVPAEANGLYEAAELALFDHGDATTLLLPRDAGRDANAADAAAKAVLDEGADVIVGPVLKDSVLGVARQTRGRRIPVIAFSSDRTAASEGVYLLSFPLEEEVARIAAYAATKNLRRIALLAPDTEYGRRVGAAFRQEAGRRGLSIVAERAYVRTDRDAAAAAQGFAAQAKAAGAQALLIPESGSTLRAIGPALLQGGLDTSKTKLLGTGAWADGEAQKEPVFAGALYPAPEPGARADFEARYRAIHGRAPTRLASLAYDAVALSALLSRDVGGQGVTNQAIVRGDGFIGANGLFRFRADGTIERALAILEVRPGGPVVAEAAVKRFGGAGS